MKRRAMAAWIAAGAGLLIASAASGAALAQSPAPGQPLALGFHISEAPIVLTAPRVIDGDTFDVGLERFRPTALDTAELYSPECPLERARAESSTNVAAQVFASAGQIVAFPTGKRDRYGRVLARIEVDGRDFAEIMIERGGGQIYTANANWDWCAETPVARPRARRQVSARAGR